MSFASASAVLITDYVFGSWAPDLSHARIGCGESFTYEDFQSLDAPQSLPVGGSRAVSLPDGHEHSVWVVGGSMRAGWYVSPVTKENLSLVHGGKRVRSGRKSLDVDGTIVSTVRLTGKQKATFDMLGGVQWLRGQLDLFAQ